MRAHNGALIVLDNPERLESLGIISGGMKVEVEFAPMRLYELAKMDGAIVVSPDISAIHYANVQLSPDSVSRVGGDRECATWRPTARRSRRAASS